MSWTEIFSGQTGENQPWYVLEVHTRTTGAARAISNHAAEDSPVITFELHPFKNNFATIVRYHAFLWEYDNSPCGAFEREDGSFGGWYARLTGDGLEDSAWDAVENIETEYTDFRYWL